MRRAAIMKRLLLLAVFSFVVIIVIIATLRKQEFSFYSHRIVARIVERFKLNKQPATEYNLCDENVDHPVGSRVLSYTLYGSWATDPKWYVFLGEIAEEARNSAVYRHWTIRLYHDHSLDNNWRRKFLRSHDNIVLCNISNVHRYGDLAFISGMEWRLLAIGDPSVDVVCIRDIDSPLIQRELDAVTQWMESGKYFSALRDHPQEWWPIMGGLFCVRTHKNRTLTGQIFDLLRKNFNSRRLENGKIIEPDKESDQKILRDFVWPLVRYDAMQHDAYHCENYNDAIPFPSRRITNTSGFMGCKRPCTRVSPPCPSKCRPPDHQDWTYC